VTKKEAVQEAQGSKKDSAFIGNFGAMSVARDEGEKREVRKEFKKPVFTGKARLMADVANAESAPNQKQNYDFSGMQFSSSSNKRPAD